MRSVLRACVCLLIGSSIAFASLPGQMPRVEVVKTDCCAKMKVHTVDCDKHVPQPDPENQCCAACAFGLAAVLTASGMFVYPPTGDETFAAYISSGHFLAHPPLVPPPRA